MIEPSFAFDNSFARELQGFYVPWHGSPFPAPKLLCLNQALATELGLDAAALQSPAGAAALSGAVPPTGATPLAMAYAGHQFGGFSPQLGDGRALLLGELLDRNGRRRDIHLKGSGPTPFSRGGDGKAALGPVLREYLIGEAMHALGIPTTRALAVVLTGESIHRDGLKPGAVLTRVAASHLRVGTFEFFAARGENDKVRLLADYAIARHYPHLIGQPDRYLGLLRGVCDAQATLLAKWMLVGFVHGVMNTDNTTISGETIDYGPCAFMDRYDPKTVFSSIDHGGRYAYGNQAAMAQWNLARFAQTLIDLIEPRKRTSAVELATHEVDKFADSCQSAWLAGMQNKLGLTKPIAADLDLVNELLAAMSGQNVDFTSLFRALPQTLSGDADPARALFDDHAAFDVWLTRYLLRAQWEGVDAATRTQAMNQLNPLYIPRNHKVEAALAAAVLGDMAPFDTLLAVLKQPFWPMHGCDDFAQPAALGPLRYRTFCGT